MDKNIKFLDIFAGAGGLSEGFIRAGYTPIAHVEMDLAACFTLKTRIAYRWLKSHGGMNTYYHYLYGKISRTELYANIPESIFLSVINAEISKESLPEIFKRIEKLLNGDSLDLIIGGPPCQAYSLANHERNKNIKCIDTRNYLYIYYVDFLKRYHPRYFIFENVVGLLSSKSKGGVNYFENMQKLFKEAGYETEYKVLSADDYGVLQKRKRVILVGKRGIKAGFYPQPEIWKPDATVDDIFYDLPKIKAGEGKIHACQLDKAKSKYLYDAGILNAECVTTFHQARPHSERALEIYRFVVRKWNEKHERLDYNELPERLKTHSNRETFLDRYKLVAADLAYSHIVTAHLARDGNHHIHPDIIQNRSITPREAARLQSFPDDYFFESASEKPGYTAAFKQIGNAVPVLMAQKIAEKLKDNW